MISERFIEQIGITSSAVSQTFDDLKRIYDAYWARGYSTVTDEDLAAYGMTVAQLTGIITLAEQTALFRSGQATTPVNHNAVLNQLRRDI
jgi:hypothetical protein